jgi:hypothetical protein
MEDKAAKRSVRIAKSWHVVDQQRKQTVVSQTSSAGLKPTNISVAFVQHPLFGKRNGLQWPTTTDIWCWFCTDNFDSYPVPVPIKYNMITKIFDVFAVCCSWNCVKAFILDRNQDHNHMLMLMCTMARQVFNTCVTDIIASSPKSRLKRFGGTMTFKAYHASSKYVTSSVVSPPFQSYTMLYEERVPKAALDARNTCIRRGNQRCHG